MRDTALGFDIEQFFVSLFFHNCNLLNKYCLILSFVGSQKGTSYRTKGTHLSPLLIGDYAACLARVGEKILKCSYWRGAYERERERESSKLFGTTK